MLVDYALCTVVITGMCYLRVILVCLAVRFGTTQIYIHRPHSIFISDKPTMKGIIGLLKQR